MIDTELFKRLSLDGISYDERINFLLNSAMYQDEEWNILKQNYANLGLNIATVFSGIGSPEFALKRLGIKHNILFAGDIDKYCKVSYFANYDIDESKWHTDIREFEASGFVNSIDLFIGGSPCQSFSIGGKRKGFEEARGTLFYEYARVVKECKPKVFVYENVTGMLNHDKGHTWEVVQHVFDLLGYSWRYFVLNAKDYGIPQNRKRIFVVGFRRDVSDYFNVFSEPSKRFLGYELEDLLEKNVANRYYLPKKGFERVVDPKQLRHVVLNGRIARTQVANQQYNWYGDMRFETNISERLENDERVFKSFYNGVRGVARCLTPRECLRLMGYDDTFVISVNDQQMYKQCGNSIVVNVMMEIIKAIIKTGVFQDE